MRRIMALLSSVLVILIVWIFLIWSFVSTKNYVSTTAIVTAVEYDPTVTSDDDPEDYEVTLEYTVDGQTYTASIHAHESDYSVGQETELKYNPKKPGSISMGSLPLPVAIGLGIVATVIGLLGIIRSIR